MVATTNVSAFSPYVQAAVSQLQQGASRYDHVILAASEGSTSRSAPIQLVETAAGGLDALRSKLRTRETRFALLRVNERILLIVSLGTDLNGLKRAQVLVQGRALQSSLGANIFAAVTIADASQLTSALVGSKLQLEGFEPIASPNVTQDFRASWASTSGASIATRGPPSAPSSPEKIDREAQWSHLNARSIPYDQNEGPSRTTSIGSLAKSFYSSRLAKLTDRGRATAGIRGMVIDLESVVDDSHLDRGAQRAPVLPPKPKQTPLTIHANDSDDDTADASSCSTVTPTQYRPMRQNLHQPILLRKQSDPNLPGFAFNREALSPGEQKRLSDERERVRLDETVRDEVMKKLQAEQRSSLTANANALANRISRLPISPPLAPPPPFALPPAPALPSPSSVNSARLSGNNHQSIPLKNRQEDDNRTVKANPVGTRSASAAGSYSSRISESDTPTQDVHPSTTLLEKAPRESESQESIRSSMQSVYLWEYAETASQAHSFLSLPEHTSFSSRPISTFRAERPASDTFDQKEGRSRQASWSESVTSMGFDNIRFTTSSSVGSVAASSIFDKELPAPPVETERSVADIEDWTSALGSTRSLRDPSIPWMDSLMTTQSEEQRLTTRIDGAEMQDLRDKLAQAEARAKTAEEAAKVAVREAQSETQRLAEELASLERGTKDKTEQEAVRRAKWAREQAARNQLNAYERSKLEADEKRRRRAIEEQRQLECDRANRIREERERCEQEAERIKQEYEIQIQQLAIREAKLKAEAATKEQRERERIEQEQARASHRQSQLIRFKQALLEEGEAKNATGSAPLISGWLNLQVEGAIQRKRRWYRVMERQLVLTRSPTDSSLMTRIPLDPRRLVAVSSNHDDCTTSHSLHLEVLLDGDSDHESDSVESTKQAARCTYVISTDTGAGKEEIELVIEAIASI